MEKAVNGFANAGVPMEKLILGVPFYSRKWDGVKGAGCRNGLGMEAETVGGYGGDYGELKESWIGKVAILSVPFCAACLFSLFIPATRNARTRNAPGARMKIVTGS